MPSLKTLCLRAAAVGALAAAAPLAASAETLLLRDPALSEDRLAFVYAGDIWVAGRDGANPRRLTAHAADESDPVFSPDGETIAFTANYDGNTDVYTIPTAGGQPTRLTWHPGDDVAVDWTAEGDAVAFVSRRETGNGRSAQLYHVSLDGGLPEKQMEARVFRGAYDEETGRFANVPNRLAYNGLYGGAAGWRGYRGGASPSIQIIDLEAETARDIAGDRVSDHDPMWMDGDLYFLSDREDKVFNIFRFDEETGETVKVSDETIWDVRNADAEGGLIVYEAGGRLKSLDPESGETDEISISISPDLPQLQAQWTDASDTVTAADLSPNGKRVAITARGDVFTAPVDKGSTRNLTRTSGGREYSAIWSPDGQELAYVVDTGEAQILRIEDQTGLNEARDIPLGSDFYTLRAWGEGGRIVYESNHLDLRVLDVASGSSRSISKDIRRDEVDLDISPDGRWLAYTQEQANFNRDLRLYDLQTGRSHQVTDALADAASPAFSKDGKLLYFTGSTNSGPLQVGLDMTSQERPYRAGVYVAILEADGASPLAPKTGDEEAPDADNGEDETENGEDDAVAVAPDGIGERIEALALAEQAYDDLHVAKSGDLFFVRRVQPGVLETPPGQDDQAASELMRFDIEDLEAASVMEGVAGAQISRSGEQILIQKVDDSWETADVGDELKTERLNLSGVKTMVDPRAEWAQIFTDVWRMERAFFYDPNMHGLDWDAVRDRYEPLVAHVGRREDLNELLTEMIGEMQVGHNNVGGGDVYRGDGPGVGLLGADFRIENGRHRIVRIYTGENWNPFIEAPLAAPGVDVNEGDYVLAVDGQELGEGGNIFALLQGTAGKQVSLRVSSRADGRNARDVLVEPNGNEGFMRLWAWVEDNRKAVDEATDGRVGYVYLPNTAGAGYAFFNRMFFAQTDKEAMIVDERSNGGGQAANYIVDVLSRTYLSGWKDRDGLIFNTPGAAMYGPKVMLIDQDAGSGGDYLPYSFRHLGIGPLIGTRTWGGLIGISVNPALIDGGFLTVPFFRYFDTNGEWSIENEGVEPDIVVPLDPIAYNDGRDTQLERAIAEVRARLETDPSPVPTEAPPYPTRLGE